MSLRVWWPGRQMLPRLPGPLLSPDPEVEATAIRLNTMAYGTKLPQVRNPAKPD